MALSGILEVRVIPNAARDEIVGFDEEGVLKVKVAPPAQDGRANKQLIKVIAKKLHIRKSAVSIVSGETSRRKRLDILGVAAAELPVLLEKGS